MTQNESGKHYERKLTDGMLGIMLPFSGNKDIKKAYPIWFNGGNNE